MKYHTHKIVLKTMRPQTCFEIFKYFETLKYFQVNSIIQRPTFHISKVAGLLATFPPMWKVLREKLL